MRALTQHKIVEKAEALIGSDLKGQSLSVAEYLLLLHALMEIEPEIAPQLHQHFFQHRDSAIPNQGFELISGLSLQIIAPVFQGSALWKEPLQAVLDQQEQTRQRIDLQYSGIVQVQNQNEQLSAQCYWIRNIESLLLLAPATAETPELILQLEIHVHETNEQLWDEQTGNYRPESASLSNLGPAHYLPMWANIPSLDQAEQLLRNLRSSTAPWQSETKAKDWCVAESFFLFQGLRHYEMFKAAEELRSYVLGRLSANKDNWQQACLSLCFAASSPA